MSSLKKLSHLFRGFTLVELIVVISVLAVLATIAISQISNITSSARDSQRLTDITSMKSALENYAALKGVLPIPSSSTAIVYSGGTVWTQGTFGESVVRTLKSISPKPIDPKYNLEYVYSVANTGKEYELGGVLEKVSGMNFPIPQPLPQGRGVVGKEVVGAFPRKALPTPLSKAFLQGWALFDETSTNLKSLKGRISKEWQIRALGFRGTNLSFDKFAPALSSFFSPSPLGEGVRGWGLENSLFDTVSAASAQNIAVVKGNYSGLSLKVVTGSTTYILAVPTLIAQDTASGNILNLQLVIDGKWSLPKGFAQSVTSTAQTGTFVPTLAWSGEKLPTTQTGIAQMVQWLQTAYSGTNASSLTQIQTLLTLTGTTNLTNYGNGLISGNLGGSAVTLAPEVTAETPPPAAASCTLPWGGTIESGQSVTAYSATGVVSPAVCSSVAQTRTCTNGTLSGTYTNQACAQVTDLYAANVVSLLHFDGNLNDIKGKVWTPVSGATTSAAQSKFGGNSLYLNGTTQYLTTPASSDFAFGTEDFTVDFWIYPTRFDNNYEWYFGFNPDIISPTSTNFSIWRWRNGIADGRMFLEINDDGTGGTGYYGSTFIPTINQWHHIAAVRSGNMIYIFANGVKVGEYSNFTKTISNSELAYIGLINVSPTPSWLFQGYMDEFRVTKGAARWTSNFTPPSTADTGVMPPTMYFSGAGTVGDPWKKYDGSVLTSCQAYNLAAMFLNNNTARWVGACGNGSQACLNDGIYNINPDGLGVLSVYCDMNDNGGGWTKLMHANYNNFFTADNWSNLNANNPESTTLYSILNKRDAFKIDGKYTFRFQIGRTGTVGTYKSTLTKYNAWKQTHDPFTQTTDGSDYEYLAGEAPTTCGGFNGLHNKYQGITMTSDADSNDLVACWWMQVVPKGQYGTPAEFAYLDGYGGIYHSHVWQILWLK